jgi:hypothetical protein
MKALRVIAILAAVVASVSLCFAYIVGPPLKLDELVKEADIIVKATVISSKPVQDEWFTACPGFAAYGTELKVVSVIKGNVASDTITFQHYGFSKADQVCMFMPQHYELEVGRTYIVFAKTTDREGAFRQLWQSHKAKEDQGVTLAANAEPVAAGKPVKDIIWAELCALLKSADPGDVVYAIGQLDETSGGRYYALDDFERGPVLEMIHPFLSRKDKQVATAAILAVGADSPYLKDDYAPHWLTNVGGGRVHGFTEWNRDSKNPGGRAYWQELAAVGNGDAPNEVRALAIRALGRVAQPGVMNHVVRWLQDPDRLIRQAAVILLADYPGEKASKLLADCAIDETAEVRTGVARAIGCGQLDGLLPLLERLLADTDPHVSAAAALSLVSFPADKVDAILKAHMDDAEFRSVFFNALAETDPEPYLDALAEIIEKRLEPTYFWGGQIPHGLSWEILFKYLEGKSADELGSGELDKYMNALEQAQFYGSSEPRDLYAFYLKHGLPERARVFRSKCKATFTYDIDYYFNQVDKECGIGAGE